MSVIAVDEYLITELTKSFTDHNVNGIVFKYLGKGAEGVIYKYLDKGDDKSSEKVIKIYTKDDIDAVIKEFFVVGLLQELNKINKNVIKIDRYYLSLSRPVLTMELMDGNLSEWGDDMVKNKNNLTQDALDKEWLSMMFQITYGLMFLNKLKILHTDTKAKNILFRKLDEQKETIYQIDGRTFKVPINYQFKIADFGTVQILGSTLNTISNDAIKERIAKRDDLHELSRILYRVLVNYGKQDYRWKQIIVLVRDNKAYEKYYKDQQIQIDKDLGNIPKEVRNAVLLKALIYYGIENNIINKKDIITKYSLKLPSKNVENILDKLTDTSIKNVFDLFEVFLTK